MSEVPLYLGRKLALVHAHALAPRTSKSFLYKILSFKEKLPTSGISYGPTAKSVRLYQERASDFTSKERPTLLVKSVQLF